MNRGRINIKLDLDEKYVEAQERLRWIKKKLKGAALFRGVPLSRFTKDELQTIIHLFYELGEMNSVYWNRS